MTTLNDVAYWTNKYSLQLSNITTLLGSNAYLIDVIKDEFKTFVSNNINDKSYHDIFEQCCDEPLSFVTKMRIILHNLTIKSCDVSSFVRVMKYRLSTMFYYCSRDKFIQPPDHINSNGCLICSNSIPFQGYRYYWLVVCENCMQECIG